ncbi:MAG: hypothetical protein ACXVDN_13255 [Ktedonobacteraceae bacterium]
MQSSGQQPQEKTERENVEIEDSKDQAGSPLYEFPADQPGMVYPPPPSYYQSMHIPEARAALPYQAGTSTSQAPLNTVGVPVAPSGPTRYPEMQPKIKKSHRWVWIVVSIFGVGFLVTCGLCGWGTYQLVNSVINQETGATDVVNTYFQDVQNQRYEHAYQSLQINGLTLEDYTKQAQTSDTQNGLLLSFAIEQPTFDTNANSGPDLNKWSYTVNLTRAKTSYPVLVTVEKVGGSWKITYIDKY